MGTFVSQFAPIPTLTTAKDCRERSIYEYWCKILFTLFFLLNRDDNTPERYLMFNSLSGGLA